MTLRRLLVATLCVAACLQVAEAKTPVRYLGLTSLGIEYYGMARGQMITSAGVPSNEWMHLAVLYYAPVEYVQFSAGAGVARFEVAEYQDRVFVGKFGFSPVAGLNLYTPAFFEKVMRITLGFDFQFINSTDKYDYRYSGPVVDAGGGLLFHAGRYVDAEIGAKAHIIDGTMRDMKTGRTGIFSNEEIARVYTGLTLCAPKGPYVRLYFDASPAFTTDWQAGPVESSVGISVGTIIRDDRVYHTSEKETDKYFPEYEEMKKRQDRMSEEIEDLDQDQDQDQDQDEDEDED